MREKERERERKSEGSMSVGPPQNESHILYDHHQCIIMHFHIQVEDSATSVEGVLCKDGEEEGETLPPAKKAKLTTTNDGGVADNTTLLKHVSDSTEPEGTEHAQSDVAMDMSLPDERDKNQDRQCGVSIQLQFKVAVCCAHETLDMIVLHFMCVHFFFILPMYCSCL